MISYLIISVFVLILLCSWFSFIKDSNSLNTRGPFPFPLFGNGLLFIGDTSHFLTELGDLLQEYGDTVRIYLLSLRYIILTNPKHIEPIMSSMDTITKGESYTYLHPWLGQGLLTSTGQKWQKHRKFLTPAFHFNILQSFLPIFLKNEVTLISNLRRRANGEVFDLFPVIALAALDNVTEAAMGVFLNAQGDSESEYVRAVQVIGDITMGRMFNPLLSPNFIFGLLPQKKQYDKALSVLHKQTNKVIEERHKALQASKLTLESYTNTALGIKKRSSFLDLLLLSEVDGQKLDLDSIREEVDTFMFEGHDTTTSAICFTLYCIANNSGIDDKIIDEQRLILGDDIHREPTYSELQKMKYLELVLKESLRLYPSVPLMARCITKECYIAGIKFPKNTTATIDIFHMQRNPEYFEEPLEFRPERFDLTNSNQRDKYSWIPFSAGPRNCIGQKFAMMELKITIASIIKHFKILPSGIEPVLAVELILKSKTGVNVKLVPRN